MSRWTIANRLSDGSEVYFRLTVHRVDHLLIIGLDCYRGTALNNYLNLVGGINRPEFLAISGLGRGEPKQYDLKCTPVC